LRNCISKKVNIENVWIVESMDKPHPVVFIVDMPVRIIKLSQEYELEHVIC
jgi:hypothetical protein